MSKEKQSEWISMEERLPNEGEEVLIYAGEIGVAKLVRGISEEKRRKMKISTKFYKEAQEKMLINIQQRM